MGRVGISACPIRLRGGPRSVYPILCCRADHPAGLDAAATGRSSAGEGSVIALTSALGAGAAGWALRLAAAVCSAAAAASSAAAAEGGELGAASSIFATVTGVAAADAGASGVTGAAAVSHS